MSGNRNIDVSSYKPQHPALAVSTKMAVVTPNAEFNTHFAPSEGIFSMVFGVFGKAVTRTMKVGNKFNTTLIKLGKKIV